MLGIQAIKRYALLELAGIQREKGLPIPVCVQHCKLEPSKTKAEWGPSFREEKAEENKFFYLLSI